MAIWFGWKSKKRTGGLTAPSKTRRPQREVTLVSGSGPGKIWIRPVWTGGLCGRSVPDVDVSNEPVEGALLLHRRPGLRLDRSVAGTRAGSEGPSLGFTPNVIVIVVAVVRNSRHRGRLVLKPAGRGSVRGRFSVPQRESGCPPGLSFVVRTFVAREES